MWLSFPITSPRYFDRPTGPSDGLRDGGVGDGKAVDDLKSIDPPVTGPAASRVADCRPDGVLGGRSWSDPLGTGGTYAVWRRSRWWRPPTPGNSWILPTAGCWIGRPFGAFLSSARWVRA